MIKITEEEAYHFDVVILIWAVDTGWATSPVASAPLPTLGAASALSVLPLLNPILGPPAALTPTAPTAPASPAASPAAPLLIDAFVSRPGPRAESGRHRTCVLRVEVLRAVVAVAASPGLASSSPSSVMAPPVALRAVASRTLVLAPSAGAQALALLAALVGASVPHHVSVARVSIHLVTKVAKPVGSIVRSRASVSALPFHRARLLRALPRVRWRADGARRVARLCCVAERLGAAPHVARVAEVEGAVSAVAVLVFALEPGTTADLPARIHALAEGDLRVERIFAAAPMNVARTSVTALSASALSASALAPSPALASPALSPALTAAAAAPLAALSALPTTAGAPCRRQSAGQASPVAGCPLCIGDATGLGHRPSVPAAASASAAPAPGVSRGTAAPVLPLPAAPAAASAAAPAAALATASAVPRAVPARHAREVGDAWYE